MSKNITELTKNTFSEAISKGVTLVDYWATWCGPCKMLAPILEQVAEEMAGRVRVCKVNVDDENELAVSAQVSSIPNMCIYRDGALVGRMVGLTPADEIIDELNKYL